jgi:hypothetical protein
MTPERAFKISNNLDIPSNKRKFWPKYSEVVVSQEGFVHDVIQFFEVPTEQELVEIMKWYPRSVSFPVTAEATYTELDDFIKKVNSCIKLGKKVLKKN